MLIDYMCQARDTQTFGSGVSGDPVWNTKSANKISVVLAQRKEYVRKDNRGRKLFFVHR
jgi:hypothetical protein